MRAALLPLLLVVGCGNLSQGRLFARPGGAAPLAAPLGEQSLGLDAARDALVYVPPNYTATSPAPLAVLLHGAGRTAQSMIDGFRPLADEFGAILLAPQSRAATWDGMFKGGLGPDVAFLDRALARTFARFNIGRVALVGFSDGASYALALGLANGDLFPNVIAFSPGFARPPARRGRPSLFVSHGTADRVLPIDRASRAIVPDLRARGYSVDYREFDGGHLVPEDLARAAFAGWLQ